jgi:hypothetical protein
MRLLLRPWQSAAGQKCIVVSRRHAVLMMRLVRETELLSIEEHDAGPDDR